MAEEYGQIAGQSVARLAALCDGIFAVVMAGVPVTVGDSEPAGHDHHAGDDHRRHRRDEAGQGHQDPKRTVARMAVVWDSPNVSKKTTFDVGRCHDRGLKVTFDRVQPTFHSR